MKINFIILKFLCFRQILPKMLDINSDHITVLNNHGYDIELPWKIYKYDIYDKLCENTYCIYGTDKYKSYNKILVIGMEYTRRIYLKNYEIFICLKNFCFPLSFIPKTLKILFLPANYTYPLGNSLIDKYLTIVCIENINLLQPNCLPPTIKALYVREQIDSDITQIDPTPYIVNVDTFGLPFRTIAREKLETFLVKKDVYVRLINGDMFLAHKNILFTVKFFRKLFDEELTFDKYENLDVIPFDSFESFEINKNIFSYFYNKLDKSYYDTLCPSSTIFPNLNIINPNNNISRLDDTNEQINYFQLLRQLLDPSDFGIFTGNIVGAPWNQFFWLWVYSSNKSISDYTFIFSYIELYDCQSFLERQLINNDKQNDLNLFFGKRYVKQ